MNSGARQTSLWRRNRWRISGWAIAVLILLLPLFAMQVTDQVVWDVLDFAIFAALLIGVGVAFELAARKTENTAYRYAVGIALTAAFLLIWVIGAVGIIGAAGNRADLMYGGVLAVGIIGSVIARFRSHGMSRALFATAVAQALVGSIALITGLVPVNNSAYEILGLNGIFVVLFVVSAVLFRKSGQRGGPSEPIR